MFYKCVFPLLFLLSASPFCIAQEYELIDGFENGLQNWNYSYTEYPDYFGWGYHPGNYILGLSDENVAFGEQALRLDPENSIWGAVRCVKSDFYGVYGIYTSWIYMEPNDELHMSTDGLFYFQYQHPDRYYSVTVYPADSDNPGIKLRKMVDGNLEVIGESGPLTVFNQWYKLIVERPRTGEIIVSIFDPETGVTTEAINIYDISIPEQGHLGVGCFSNSVLWDEIGFVNTNVELNMFNNDSLYSDLDDQAIELDIYPNPSSDEFFVNIISDVIVTGYTIYSIEGKKIKEIDPKASSVIVSDIKSGLYMLQIRTEDKVSSEMFTIIR